MLDKFKAELRSQRSFLVLLLCLTGVVAFMLGRSSVSVVHSNKVNQVTPQSNQAGVLFIEAPVEPSQPTNAITDVAPVATQQTVVASVNGTRYHLLTCSGANSINEANKIFFNSIEEARAAGYTPAANCAGLQ